MKAFAAATALLAVLLAAFPARADAEKEAEALIAKGIELRKKGQEFEAESYFQRAYQLAHTPRAAGQLGLVEQGLSRWAEAEKHLAEALDAGRDPWIHKVRGTLEESLKKVRLNVAQIEIRGEPAAAEVVVNGQPVGKLPLLAPVHVGKGYAEIEVRAPGYTSSKRTLTVEGAHFYPFYVTLDREGAPPPPERHVASERPAEHPEVTAAGAPAPTDSAPAKLRPLQITGIAVGAAGLACVGLGIKKSLDVKNLQDDYDREKDPARRQKLESDGKSASTQQWIWYGVGGAALVGGVVLLVTGGGPAHAGVALRPVLAPDGAGFQAAGTF